MRLVAVSSTMSTRPISQTGRVTQSCRRLAPAIVSAPTAMIQKYQYSQAETKLARGPSAKRM